MRVFGRTRVVHTARMLAIGLVALALSSTAQARPWEPIETMFDFDQAPFRNGVLVLPSFGLLGATTGDKSRVSNGGLRMGAIIGWHVSPRLSVNGEVGLAALEFKENTTRARDVDTGFLLEYGLAPLFHQGAPKLEIVVGPKLGRFRYSLPEAPYGEPFSRSLGWTYGVNVGAFAPLQSMAIGGLLSYTVNRATTICDTTCHARTSSVGDVHVLALSFAMLY